MTDIHAKLQEEKLLRAIRAKRRFRAACRHVIHNISWLQDDDTYVIDPSNVKQAVTRLVCKKKPDKGLSIREKAVLRKQIKYRTDEEKALLNKYIGGLKCFRKYPENVQQELVGVTYFEYCPRGRVLVKQNQEAHAMYFLLSGEVVVTKTIWDEIANENTDVRLGVIQAGNMFGEVSLLHNVLRTATVTTTAPCEMLVLKKEDFDRVLKASLMQRWDDIREAMINLTYFDQWDSVAIRECCILSKIKTYTQNQVVCGDRPPKKGAQHMSYFVISGSCSIVEHLFIEETVKRGVKYYKLYEPPESIIPADKLDLDSKFSYHDEYTAESFQTHKDSFNKSTDEIENKFESTENINTSKYISDHSFPGRKLSTFQNNTIQPARAMSIMAYKFFLKKELQSYQMQMQESKLPLNVEIRFMQICTLGPKATFLEGELMKNRRVIALTPVRILLIPSYWLNQHNKGNVWTRVEQFLHNRIPSTKSVFNKYVTNKKWQDYKKKLRNDILSQKKISNNTTIHDVPYSIRIVSNYE